MVCFMKDQIIKRIQILDHLLTHIINLKLVKEYRIILQVYK